jgi:hypothetical protein
MISNSSPQRGKPVNKQTVSLAQRRAELIELCALQRGFLAQECEALRSPFSLGAIRDYLGANKTVTLAIAGAALGLAVVRPKRVLSLVAAVLPVLKMARKALPMLARRAE